MNDAAEGSGLQTGQSAGAMLKAARQAQGLHIAALATMLKVTPRKLEALEADRHDDLQGPTFVRALAQAACRALKIDPSPVLARLPDVNRNTLDQVSGGLNAPFREHGLRRDPTEWPVAGRSVAVAVLVMLAAAAAMWWLPSDWRWPSWSLGTLSAVWPSSASPASPSVVSGVVPTAAAGNIAPQEAGDNAQMQTNVAPERLLQVRARAESWVDVTDGSGQSLLSRTLQPGETVDLDGALPLRVKIGNAQGTELSFRGQIVDVGASTRDNIARLELK